MNVVSTRVRRNLRHALLLLALAAPSAAADWRRFTDGRLIPDEGYCDQPYLTVTRDGNWLCTMTTGRGTESKPGQHVVATISADQGRTWTPLIDIEPATEKMSSWVVPLLTPAGRVYAFYNYNGDDVSELNGEPIPNPALLGWYVYKFSDDHGRTWSARRYRLPLPVAPIDRGNDWKGAVQMFWGIDKPDYFGGAAMFAFSRLGRYHPRFPRAPSENPPDDTWRTQAVSELGEGWFFRSDNLRTERDPERIRWELLPPGGQGLRRADFDPIQQEHNLAELSDGGIHCVYRTAMGHLAGATSRDGGRTWTTPEAVTYASDGRVLKNSIACAMIWRVRPGRFLLWYHNNSDMQRGGGPPVTSRNPVWLAAGTERGGRLQWSEPELIGYNADPKRGSSYPDLIEVGGRFFLSATNKREARLAALDPALVAGLLDQENARTVTRTGLVLDADRGALAGPAAAFPRLPRLDVDPGGFSVELWLRDRPEMPGEVLFDTRDEQGRGWRLVTAGQHQLELQLADGAQAAQWRTDPGALDRRGRHHVVFVVDGGPRMISVVLDGRVADGGPTRAWGFGRFFGPKNTGLGDISGRAEAMIGPAAARVERLRLYDRALRTTEAIGNFRAGP